MLGMAAVPPRLIVGALLAVCMLPQCSSITVMREEVSSNTTISKSELKALLKVARADLQTEMRKSGVAVSDPGTATSPSQPNPGRLLTGRRYNCVQTFVTLTEPLWSIIEAIAATVDSCKGTKTECYEATLSVTEASLGLITYILDFPTDCLGRTCGKKAENEKERIDPTNFGLTMISGGLDFVTAGVGAAAGSLGVYLQCKEKLGDSLGLLESEKPSPWLHPSMVSFVPSVKDIRENYQAMKGSETETPNQRAEKRWAALERAVGMAQSIMETLMHEHSQGGSPDAKASAADGCAAASTHIVASLLALVTSWYKSVACWRGELELPAAIDEWDYGTAVASQSQSGRNKGPKKPRDVEPKTAQISGGGSSETDSGSGTGSRKKDLCKLDDKLPLVERCSSYAKQYRQGFLTPTGQKCQEKCCDEASYPKDKSHDSKLQILLFDEEYCTNYVKPLQTTRVKSAPIYGDDSNMARESHRKKTKDRDDVLRQKSVTHQIAVSSNPDI